MTPTAIPSGSTPQVAAQPTQTISKQSQATEVRKENQQRTEQARADEERRVQAQAEAQKKAQIEAQKTTEPKPVINTSGQTVGSRISTTA